MINSSPQIGEDQARNPGYRDTLFSFTNADFSIGMESMAILLRRKTVHLCLLTVKNVKICLG